MKQTNLPHGAAVPDDALFRSLPKEDCPICCLPLPTLYTGKAYKSCCGQELCKGCLYSAIAANQATIEGPISRKMRIELMKCPFCRAPPPGNGQEMMERTVKRAGMGDPLAIHNLGCAYNDGIYGHPRNPAKALKLWRRAGELGCAKSHYNLGQAYLDDDDDEPRDTPAGAFIVDGSAAKKDQTKAQYYYELAASKGHVLARHNLGCIEEELGNVDRALKHFKIAAEAGDRDSLDTIRMLYAKGRGATKSDYAEALRAYQAATDEIKSAQRDAVAAWRNEHRYLE